MKSETFRERLTYFHKQHLGIAQYIFAERIGLGQERVRKGMMTGKQPTAEFFEAVFKAFPDLSPDWVFTGRGAMLTGKSADQVPKAPRPALGPAIEHISGKNLRVLSTTNDSEGNENIEVVNTTVAASYIDNIQAPEFLTTLPKISLPGAQFRNGTFRAFEVKGNSMEPTIQQYSWVVGQFLLDWNSLKDDYIYIVVMADAILIKRVLNRIEGRQQIVLKSDNPDFEHMIIGIEDVKELWQLKAELRFNFKNTGKEMYLQLQHLIADVEEIKSKVGI